MRDQIIIGDKFDLPLDELFESSLELSGREQHVQAEGFQW